MLDRACDVEVDAIDVVEINTVKSSSKVNNTLGREESRSNRVAAEVDSITFEPSLNTVSLGNLTIVPDDVADNEDYDEIIDSYNIFEHASTNKAEQGSSAVDFQVCDGDSDDGTPNPATNSNIKVGQVLSIIGAFCRFFANIELARLCQLIMLLLSAIILIGGWVTNANPLLYMVLCLIVTITTYDFYNNLSPSKVSGRLAKATLRERIELMLCGGTRPLVSVNVTTGVPAGYRPKRRSPNIGRHRTTKIYEMPGFDDLPVVEIEVPSSYTVASRYFVEVLVQGVKTIKACIDTAAGVSVISTNCLLKLEQILGHPIPRSNSIFGLVGYGSSPISTKGVVFLNIQIGRLLLKNAPFFVSDTPKSSSELLLGQNILLSQKIGIGHEEENGRSTAVLTFKPELNLSSVKLELVGPKSFDAAVCEVDTEVLLPKQTKVVKGTLSRYPYVKHSLDRKPALLTMKSEFEDVLSCDDIVESRGGVFSTTLTNISDHPVGIAEGFDLFEMESFEDLQDEYKVDVTPIVAAAEMRVDMKPATQSDCLCELNKRNSLGFITNQFGATSVPDFHRITLDGVSMFEDPGTTFFKEKQIFFTPHPQEGFRQYESSEEAERFASKYLERQKKYEKQGSLFRERLYIVVNQVALVPHSFITFCHHVKRHMKIEFLHYDAKKACDKCKRQRLDAALKDFPEFDYIRRLKVIVPSTKVRDDLNTKPFKHIHGTSRATIEIRECKVDLFFEEAYALTAVLHIPEIFLIKPHTVRNLLYMLLYDLRMMFGHADLSIQTNMQKTEVSMNCQIVQATKDCLKYIKQTDFLTGEAKPNKRYPSFKNDLVPLDIRHKQCACSLCFPSPHGHVENEYTKVYAGNWPSRTPEELMQRHEEKKKYQTEYDRSVEVFMTSAIEFKSQKKSFKSPKQLHSEVCEVKVQLEELEPHRVFDPGGHCIDTPNGQMDMEPEDRPEGGEDAPVDVNGDPAKILQQPGLHDVENAKGGFTPHVNVYSGHDMSSNPNEHKTDHCPGKVPELVNPACCSQNYGPVAQEGEKGTTVHRFKNPELDQQDMERDHKVFVDLPHLPHMGDWVPKDNRDTSFNIDDVCDLDKIKHPLAREKTRELIEQFRPCFKTKPEEFQLIRDFFVTLEIKDPDSHYFQRPYPCSPRVLDRFNALITDLITKGLLSPINRVRHASAMFLVPHCSEEKRKPIEERRLRPVVDFRYLNRRILINQSNYANETPVEIFNQMSGASFISTLDCSSAFNSLLLDEKSREFVAVSLPFSSTPTLLAYTVLPLGLSIAAQTFSTVLKMAISDEARKYIHCYMDDVAVVSKKIPGASLEENIQEHHRVLQLVLSDLERIGVLLSLKKCVFFSTSAKFLGYVINTEDSTISVIPERFSDLERILPIETKVQMQKFLGTALYISQHIPNFFVLAKPLFAAIAKCESRQKLHLEEIHQKAIRLIIDYARSVPKLSLIPPDVDLYVACDSSKFAGGACIFYLKDGAPVVVRYFSCLYSPVVIRRMSSITKELYIIYRTLLGCKDILSTHGNRFLILSDMKSLIYLYMNEAIAEPNTLLHKILIHLTSMNITFKIAWLPNTSPHIHTPDTLSRLITVPEKTGPKAPLVIGEWPKLDLGWTSNGEIDSSDIMEYLYRNGNLDLPKAMQGKSKEEVLAQIEELSIYENPATPVYQGIVQSNGLNSDEFRSFMSSMTDGSPKFDESEAEVDYLRQATDRNNTFSSQDRATAELALEQVLLEKGELSPVLAQKASVLAMEAAPAATAFSDISEFSFRKTLRARHLQENFNALGIRNDQMSHPHYAEILKRFDDALLSGTIDKLPKSLTKRYALFNGHILARKGRDGVLRPILPPFSTSAVVLIAGYHLLGHASVNAVTKAIAERFFIPHLYQQCQSIVLSCNACRFGAGTPQRGIPPGIAPHSDHPFHSIVMDFFDMKDVVVNGTKYVGILTTLDLFSKYVVLTPVTDFTSKAVIKTLGNIFRALPVPKLIYVDQAQAFLSSALAEVIKKMGAELIVPVPNSPTSHSIIERKQLNLRRILTVLMTMTKSTKWTDYLLKAQNILNNAKVTRMLKTKEGQIVKKSYSANELIFGRNVHEPLEEFLSMENLPLEKLTKRENIRQSIEDFHDWRVKGQDEIDDANPSKLEEGMIVLLKRFPIVKTSPPYFSDLFKVIRVKKRKVLLSSLFNKKNAIFAVSTRFVKPFRTTELLDLLPDNIRYCFGRHLSPETLDKSNRIPFELMREFKRKPVRMTRAKQKEADEAAGKEHEGRYVPSEASAPIEFSSDSDSSDSDSSGDEGAASEQGTAGGEVTGQPNQATPQASPPKPEVPKRDTVTPAKPSEAQKQVKPEKMSTLMENFRRYMESRKEQKKEVKKVSPARSSGAPKAQVPAEAKKASPKQRPLPYSPEKPKSPDQSSDSTLSVSKGSVTPQSSREKTLKWSPVVQASPSMQLGAGMKDLTLSSPTSPPKITSSPVLKELEQTREGLRRLLLPRLEEHLKRAAEDGMEDTPVAPKEESRVVLKRDSEHSSKSGSQALSPIKKVDKRLVLKPSGPSPIKKANKRLILRPSRLKFEDPEEKKLPERQSPQKSQDMVDLKVTDEKKLTTRSANAKQQPDSGSGPVPRGDPIKLPTAASGAVPKTREVIDPGKKKSLKKKKKTKEATRTLGTDPVEDEDPETGMSPSEKEIKKYTLKQLEVMMKELTPEEIARALGPKRGQKPTSSSREELPEEKTVMPEAPDAIAPLKESGDLTQVKKKRSRATAAQKAEEKARRVKEQEAKEISQGVRRSTRERKPVKLDDYVLY